MPSQNASLAEKKHFLPQNALGFWTGLAIFAAFNVLALTDALGVSPDAWRALAVGGLMLCWWITEALPIPAASLLPIALLPALGIGNVQQAAAPYASPIVFLFMGGFMLALAIEKWKLHLRIALNIVKLTGTNADGIILGFMLATAFLSMWISNTATTVMMLPIAGSIVSLVLGEGGSGDEKGKKNFALVMMLGIGYSAGIGGMATIIGTPPNSVLVGILQKTYNTTISFSDWLLMGLPFSAVLLTLAYLLMTKWVYPNRIGAFEGGKELVAREMERLGPMGKGEKRVLAAFIGTALLWIFRQQIVEIFPFLSAVDDSVVAVIAAVALFSIPSGEKTDEKLMDWDDTQKLPWGILLLFGGGLSLADALARTGLVGLVGEIFKGYSDTDVFILVLALTFISLFVTEVMSNVALVTVLAPVVAALAVGWGQNIVLMTVPITLAASCAFMLPMGTPPNAIVFASGHIKMSQMAKAGFWLNLISIAVIMLTYKTLMMWLWG